MNGGLLTILNFILRRSIIIYSRVKRFNSERGLVCMPGDIGPGYPRGDSTMGWSLRHDTNGCGKWATALTFLRWPRPSASWIGISSRQGLLRTITNLPKLKALSCPWWKLQAIATIHNMVGLVNKVFHYLGGFNLDLQALYDQFHNLLRF